MSLNVTFLGVEPGFDTVTIFSCPNGQCREITEYSDYDTGVEYFAEKDEYGFYYGNNVSCNTVTVNTNELRIRFTSDGPLPNVKGVYKGFSAVYLSMPLPVQAEVIGCLRANKTLTEVEGSIFAMTSDNNVLPISSTPTFWEESQRRKCGDEGDEQCHIFARRESQWWTISPLKGNGAHFPKNIFIAFREMILEDSLDVVNIYTRTNNVTKKETSISGYSPYRAHSAVKCTGCINSCSVLVGASGSISEWSEQDGDGKASCTWVIDVRSLGFKGLSLSFQMPLQTSGLRVSSCFDRLCEDADKESSLSGYYQSPIIKISYDTDSKAGFNVSWQGLCNLHPETDSTGSLIQMGSWPKAFSCIYTIAPRSAQDVTIEFFSIQTNHEILVYSGTSLEFNAQNDSLLGSLNSSSSAQTTLSSQTGIMHVSVRPLEADFVCTGCKGCGLFTSISGTFSHGPVYRKYPRNSECLWILSPRGATSVSLTFRYITMLQGRNFLRLYSCTSQRCDSPTLLAELTGYYTYTDLTVTSDTGTMLVRYTRLFADESDQFTAFWTSNREESSTSERVSNSPSH